MSTYLYDCKKCTNKSIGPLGEYCKPMTEGKQTCYIKSGDCGKDYIFACDYYTTQDKQVSLHLCNGNCKNCNNTDCYWYDDFLDQDNEEE